MVTKSTNVYYIYDQSDPRVAHRVRSKKQDERNSTSSQEAAPNELNLVRVRKVMRTGHRQGGGVRGCSSGVVYENHLVGLEFPHACGSVHTHTFSFVFLPEVIFCSRVIGVPRTAS